MGGSRVCYGTLLGLPRVLLAVAAGAATVVMPVPVFFSVTVTDTEFPAMACTWWPQGVDNSNSNCNNSSKHTNATTTTTTTTTTNDMAQVFHLLGAGIDREERGLREGFLVDHLQPADATHAHVLPQRRCKRERHTKDTQHTTERRGGWVGLCASSVRALHVRGVRVFHIGGIPHAWLARREPTVCLSGGWMFKKSTKTHDIL